jgi:hypothetical protein
MRCNKYILVSLLVVITISSNAQEGSLTVIANSKGAPEEMKFAQLKSILKGEKARWPDGSKVVIALMKTNTTVGSTTSKKIYNMSGDELNKYWLALVFQGKGQAPVFFTSTTELENFITQTPGSIGVISPPPNSARSVLVEGKKTL